MAKFIRYALASVLFAASVGCLALWWRSFTTFDRVDIPTPGFVSNADWQLETAAGFAAIGALPDRSLNNFGMWEDPKVRDAFGRQWGRLFGCFYFSLWFPISLLALAGIATLSLGRRFTLRSALIAVTVVAALLGMVVAL